MLPQLACAEQQPACVRVVAAALLRYVLAAQAKLEPPHLVVSAMQHSVLVQAAPTQDMAARLVLALKPAEHVGVALQVTLVVQQLA
jgi:hypothetical protein